MYKSHNTSNREFRNPHETRQQVKTEANKALKQKVSNYSIKVQNIKEDTIKKLD